jgi:hypothetical protein
MLGGLVLATGDALMVFNPPLMEKRERVCVCTKNLTFMNNNLNPTTTLFIYLFTYLIKYHNFNWNILCMIVARIFTGVNYSSLY